MLGWPPLARLAPSSMSILSPTKQPGKAESYSNIGFELYGAIKDFTPRNASTMYSLTTSRCTRI